MKKRIPKKPMRLSIYDVAQRAQVSKSTVSRVLRGGYVSEETKERVIHAMQELGYAPSAAARHLSLGRTGCIGFLAPSLEDSYQAMLVESAAIELVSRDMTLLLTTLGQRSEYHPASAYQWVHNHRVDGLLLLSPSVRERSLIEAAKQREIPMVFIGKGASFDGFTYVRSDNFGAGLKIARHLSEIGRKEVAFLSVRSKAQDAEERLAGLRAGLQETGGRVLDENIYRGDWLVEDGEAYAQKWLRLPRKKAPTAVVAASDLMALGFLRAVLSARVRVPEEVAVVGFDDIVSSRLIWPRLTTVRQEVKLLGVTAVRRLLEMIEAGKLGWRAEDLLMPTELVVRESTAGLRGQVAKGSLDM